ncbi:hypothetical protein IU433_12185 [Nocardia puris]|uniref:hypothetical protein n=1 Tax=Nocardia puris TaxID=208602 RepID=UPI0018939D77|nr:hypothetical protein [Nocardia puris]MBF6459795.1 hypothetical protein [Nocardia puris]
MALVYDADIQVTMRGVSDPVGLPYTVHPAELIDRELLIEVREGPVGDRGPQGDPAWPWQWMGDAATFADLQALPLTTADARQAWRVIDENNLYLWTGAEWIRFLNAFQAPGRQGPATVLTGVANASSVGSSASATITGTAPNQVLTITAPRGDPGDAGDAGVAGAISDAVDVDITGARQDSVLAWDTVTSTWKTVPNPRLGGPWAIAGGQFGAGSNISGDRTIATMNIPAQPVAWRPIIMSGSINIKVHANVLDDTRVNIEVRLGAVDGPLIGYGHALAATNNSMCQLVPRWEVAIGPDSAHATVAPNQTAAIYVVSKRASGPATYTITNQGAQLLVMAQPLKVQPA